jgi:hypothetical protein
MPRIPRGQQAGVVYHVINRGNGRATIFHKPQDYFGLRLFQTFQTFNRCAPLITGISPFQSFQPFNRFAPFKSFQTVSMEKPHRELPSFEKFSKRRKVQGNIS